MGNYGSMSGTGEIPHKSVSGEFDKGASLEGGVSGKYTFGGGTYVEEYPVFCRIGNKNQHTLRVPAEKEV